MRKMEVMPGTVIDKACEDAAADARLEETDVTFDFNGVQITARPTKSADEQEKHAKELAQQWRTQMKIESEAYRASPEYKRQEELRAAEITALQKEHAALMKRLPDLGDDRAWMTWIKDYVRVIDDSSMRGVRDYKTVEKAMKKAGYKPNDECMPDSLQGDARKAWAEALKADSGRYARWIAGQVLDGMNPQWPCPHPMLAGEAEEWLKKHGQRSR